MDLYKASTKELEAELAKRKADKVQVPTPLPSPNFTNLIAMVVAAIAETTEHGYEDDDFQHYVYEEVMKAIYGVDFFDWLNAVCK